MSEWQEKSLGDVLTLQRGFDITKKMQRPGPVPVVSSSGIASFHADSRADAPGVVIGRKGSLGTTFFVGVPYWPHDTTLWVKDFKRNDPYFCYLLLKTLRLADLDAGSSNPTLNRNHAHTLRVRVPGVGLQHRIAKVLRSFDDLIEINERRIELLEGLARSLYCEWFVRFRFPGYKEMELALESANSGPAGWASRRLDEIATLNRSSIHPARTPEAWFEHYSIPAFDSGVLPSHDVGASIRSSKFVVSEECVLLSKLNPRIRRVWFAVPETDSAVASSEFLPWTGEAVSNAWLWAMFSGDEFRNEIVGTAGGTSTSHQRSKPEDVSKHSLSVPPRNLLRDFDAIAEPSLRGAAMLRREIRALAHTRDLLLPRLVTGRLDVSDVDLGDLLPEAAAA